MDWSSYATGGAASRADSFTGLEPEFAANVYRLLQDAHAAGYPLQVTSAYRSPELQAILYENALKKYGSPSAARKWVAPPGRSQHNFGRAVDLAIDGSLLRDANSPAARWLRENAATYGVALPMSWEPWQIEPIGARSKQGGTPVGLRLTAAPQGGAGATPQPGAATPQPGAATPQPGAATPPPAPQRGGLFGLFGPQEGDYRTADERRRDLFANLGIGLAGMTLNPNQGLIQAAQSGIASRREAATGRRDLELTKQQRNRTAEWLRSQGRDDLANAVLSGSVGGSDAVKLAYDMANQRGVVVDDRIVDPVTGKVIYEPPARATPELSKDQLAALNTIRDDVRVELSTFEVVKQGYNNILTFYDNPGSTSDYALAVAFAKVLDPGSVAREGEVAAVQNAGAKVPALGQALKNAIDGTGSLTPKVRQEIADLATEIYAERAGAARVILDSYGTLAKQAGVPAEFIYAGQIPAVRPVVPVVAPPPPPGVDPVTWPDVWAGMSAEKRRRFVEGGQP